VEQVSSVMEADGSNERVLSATLTTYLTGLKVGLADQQWTLETAVPLPLTQFKFTNQATTGVVPTASTPQVFALTGRDGHYPATSTARMAYDSYGQLQQEQKPHSLYTTYLWGYAHALPVAQIQNASVTQVHTTLRALGFDPDALPTAEHSLRSVFTQLRQRLPQARVTGLTHQPLVGVTSQTGPDGRTVFYNYDGLGRLMRTRDEQGRILSQQQYHYAGAK
jgi:YD repeat-containing protein